jgi:hypothetical protein
MSPQRDRMPQPPEPNESRTLVFALWDFIENVTDEDPNRSEKFFALREQVRALQRDGEGGEVTK